MTTFTAAQSTQPTTRIDYGPKVVVLNQLESLYTAVPFEHQVHAEMAEMWDGCMTCHHRPPEATTRPADLTHNPATTQADSAEIPACRSCHPIAAEETDIHRPTLKGAYHRQCLNCHREWTGENACVICHTAKDTLVSGQPPPTKDDIVGRMHPPIKEPDEKLYKVRYEPVAGPNVLFRHKEHVSRFGLKCVECHRRDNCADCHSPAAAESSRPRPLKTSRTWRETHGPCVDCHIQNACADCHYREGSVAPAAFEHRQTGQLLDKDHEHLTCRQCHTNLRLRTQVSCGDAKCHTKSTVSFPAQRPGLYNAPATPTTTPTTAAASQPTTRPLLIRIRRGGR